jgi:hypothetical protein
VLFSCGSSVHVMQSQDAQLLRRACSKAIDGSRSIEIVLYNGLTRIELVKHKVVPPCKQEFCVMLTALIVSINRGKSFWNCILFPIKAMAGFWEWEANTRYNTKTVGRTMHKDTTSTRATASKRGFFTSFRGLASSGTCHDQRRF